ncbi:hypothetical protein DCAR_0311263 [Daucus carota subsp. sativus]|uniref:Uncharacterized protein n=1 Tax=Daucus carota subsp. sativus TaxID=79200 RepID=A0AAF0WLW8_DAUCS|nr:hypothetical protein DCAR_0311263 [Daucus carota subsp. sativus]
MDRYIKTHRSLNTQMRSMSLRSTSVKQNRREAALRNKLKGRKGDKEVVRRALMPPTRRPSLRWLNFRPTPSRLSNMSMASNEIVHPVCLVM